MASLQSYSCMLLTTNHKTPKTSSASARRFHVSCGVDRRDMLLGLGGLYGAAAANFKALADPIQLQDLKSCGIHNPSNMPPHENCCPPFSNAIKDYHLPPRPGQLRMRKAAQDVSPEYVDKYKEAVRRMRVLDTSYPDDPRGFMQQANVHCAYCNEFYTNHSNIPIAIHASWLFFPWHRWFLYFHERILGSLINDPTFALPFWNWDNPEGMHLPSIYDEPCSPLNDANRDERHRGAAMVDLQYFPGKPEPTDNHRLVDNNKVTMHKVMRTEYSRPEDFMGKSYRDGDQPPDPTRQGSLECGPHNHVHVWGGNPCNPFREDLGNFYSAGRDPAFYSHHANVDRLWTIWNNQNPNQNQITDPDYLNASFLFYDENRELVRVKVEDALDNTRMGYEYEVVDMPWWDFRPPMRKPGLRIRDISKGANCAFPLTLDKTVKVLVHKQNPGKVKEELVLEGVIIDGDDFVTFDVYVNTEEDEPKDVYMAEYAGTFSKLHHGGGHRSDKGGGSISFNLTELYEDININEGDNEVVVTIVPRSNGRLVTIGGIKIYEIV